jgi:hypothetical protein
LHGGELKPNKPNNEALLRIRHLYCLIRVQSQWVHVLPQRATEQHRFLGYYAQAAAKTVQRRAQRPAAAHNDAAGVRFEQAEESDEERAFTAAGATAHTDFGSGRDLQADAIQSVRERRCVFQAHVLHFQVAGAWPHLLQTHTFTRLTSDVFDVPVAEMESVPNITCKWCVC